MEDRLSRYLREEAARPFSWGTADCAGFIGGWVGLCRGIDPRSYYPRYDGEVEARRLARSGGVIRLAARAMQRAGIPLTGDPQPGDVAVVRVGDDQVACAIRTDRGWVMRGVKGLTLLPCGNLRVIASWKV
jgi:hypothetical protein